MPKTAPEVPISHQPTAAGATAAVALTALASATAPAADVLMLLCARLQIRAPSPRAVVAAVEVERHRLPTSARDDVEPRVNRTPPTAAHERPTEGRAARRAIMCPSIILQSLGDRRQCVKPAARRRPLRCKRIRSSLVTDTRQNNGMCNVWNGTGAPNNMPCPMVMGSREESVPTPLTPGRTLEASPDLRPPSAPLCRHCAGLPLPLPLAAERGCLVAWSWPASLWPHGCALAGSSPPPRARTAA
jgi:hypothetical protein